MYLHWNNVFGVPRVDLNRNHLVQLCFGCVSILFLYLLFFGFYFHFFKSPDTPIWDLTLRNPFRFQHSPLSVAALISVPFLIYVEAKTSIIINPGAWFFGCNCITKGEFHNVSSLLIAASSAASRIMMSTLGCNRPNCLKPNINLNNSIIP